MNLKEQGQRIRVERDRAGLSQSELAEKMQVSSAVLCNLEKGRRDLTLLEAMRISIALRIPLDQLCKPVNLMD